MSGRSLTSGEIQLIRSVFGDSINLNMVQIYNGYWNGLHETTASQSIMSPNGNIYWPNLTGPVFGYNTDFSTGNFAQRALFLHEMTHVFEVQSTGQNLPLAALLQPFMSGNIFQSTQQYNINGQITEERDWTSFTIEQKAEIIRAVFITAHGGSYQGYGPDDLDLLVSKLPFVPPENIAGRYQEVFGFPLPPTRTNCFLAGTPILMADGSSKPIQDIRAGDEVASFDPHAQQGLGPLKPGKVTRTFQNVTRTIIDLRGLKMTPGHVVLMDSGGWDKIAVALRDDRGIVEERGGTPTLVRARTGAVLGSIEDTPIKVIFRDQKTRHNRVALVRAGIPALARTIDEKTAQIVTMADVLLMQEYRIEADGTIICKDGHRYEATPWASDAEAPYHLSMRENWLLALDEEPFTPPWIADLPLEDEEPGEMVVNAFPQPVNFHGPGKASPGANHMTLASSNAGSRVLNRKARRKQAALRAVE